MKGYTGDPICMAIDAGYFLSAFNIPQPNRVIIGSAGQRTFPPYASVNVTDDNSHFNPVLPDVHQSLSPHFSPEVLNGDWLIATS